MTGLRIIGTIILLAGWAIFLGHLVYAKEIHLWNSVLFIVTELVGASFFYPEKVSIALSTVATPVKSFWPYKGRDDEN